MKNRIGWSIQEDRRRRRHVNHQAFLAVIIVAGATLFACGTAWWHIRSLDQPLEVAPKQSKEKETSKPIPRQHDLAEVDEVAKGRDDDPFLPKLVIPKKRIPETDLAALSVIGAGEVKALYLAREDQYMWHTPVLVMGYGLGRKDLANRGKLTEQLEWHDLSKKLGRAQGIPPFATDTLILKFDAQAQHGHSGSPVVTPDGLVVGVQSLIGAGPEENFAIHVYHVRELLSEAAPGMGVPKGKTSPTEKQRMERARRHEALKKLQEEQRKREQEEKRHPRPQPTPQRRSPLLDMFYNNVEQQQRLLNQLYRH